MRPEDDVGSSRVIPVLVFLGTLVALLPGLGDQYVWSKDEARPGLVARSEERRVGKECRL